jgi:hypothetical protein
MKQLFLSAFILFAFGTLYGQKFQSAPEGKALVYFVRTNGTGAMINFKYFDGEQYLGKMKGVNYTLYECKPGEHVFWVAAENRDFVRGNLQANCTYVIDVKPRMGALKASVKLFPVSPNDEKRLKKIKRIMSKREPIKFKKKDEDMDFFIKNGLAKYAKVENEVKVINPAWVF